MSLVPAERDALALIETQLRESDPRLAALLQAFGCQPGASQQALPVHAPAAGRQHTREIRHEPG